MDQKELAFFEKAMEHNQMKALAGNVVLTDFLDETEQAILKKYEMPGISISFDGGFIDAERKRALLKPKELNASKFEYVVFEILYSKRFLQLNHRKLLGSLMSLGIERKSIGDIVILDNKRAFFACTKEIAPYLSSHLRQVSNVPVELEECLEKIQVQKEIISKDLIVSSLRLDVLISAIYKTSRKDALNIIMEKEVFVNHLECLNPSKMLQKGDLLSVRHKGRAYLQDILGKTRSDRIHIVVGILV